MNDRTVGVLGLFVVNVAFLYYTLWMVVTPFVDSTHFTQQWFPPREYGVLIPALTVSIGFGTALSIVGWHLVN